MEDYNSSKRALLKSIAATGFTTVLPRLGGVTSVNAATTDNVEENEIDYLLDYDIERFNGDNVSVSGTVRYEEKKYAADASFYTYQGGTWVNAADDSSEQMPFTTNFYVPGTKNSQVVIEEIGSNQVDLRLPIVELYADRSRDEDDEDYPNEWVEYSFDTAWALISSQVSFFVPDPPPGVELDPERTDIISQNISGAFAELEFYDPIPPLGDGYDVTHSANWKWEISGGIEPGWNYVHADRVVDVGEWYLATGAEDFTQKAQHQVALVSAFCIYQDDYSACETDGCSQCIKSFDTDTTASTTTRDCCDLKYVERPVSISDTHIDAAKMHARTDTAAIDRGEGTRFDRQAKRSFERASDASHVLQELVAYRSAAAHARGSNARAKVKNGNTSLQTVSRHIDSTIAEIERVHDRVEYKGTSVDSALAAAAQIEKNLLSAASWTDSAREAAELNFMSNPTAVKYSESALEFAMGNIDDANRYLDAWTSNSQATDWTQAVTDAYDTPSSTVRAGLSDSLKVENSGTEYAVQHARSYVDRAAERHRNGYTAAAVVDLLYAAGYVEAVDRLANMTLKEIGIDVHDVEQELTADRYNTLAKNPSTDIQRLLLHYARLEYNSGVEAAGSYRDRGNDHDRKRAYTHYQVADAILDIAENTYDERIEIDHP